MRPPSGDRLPVQARGIGIAVGNPPACGSTASGTVQNFGYGIGALSRKEAKTTALPSGVQPRTTSGAGCQVSRRGSPPATGTTKTSTLPSYWAEKATSEPSGENLADDSRPMSAVSRRASPPSRATVHRSPP